MAKLYGSEEIYRVTRINGEKTIVPLRGLYIAGEKLDPIYKNHAVSLVGITVTPTEAVDYGTKYEDETLDGSFGVLDVNIDDVFTVSPYTSEYDDTYIPDGSFGVLDVNIDDVFTMSSYTKSEEDAYIPDGTFGIVSLTLSDSYTYSIITTFTHGNPEPAVRLTSLTVSPLEYDD